MNHIKVIKLVDIPSRIKPKQTIYERLFNEMKDKQEKSSKIIFMPWDENKK